VTHKYDAFGAMMSLYPHLALNQATVHAVKQRKLKARMTAPKTTPKSDAAPGPRRGN
jgi:hypothetical protein